MIREVVDQGTGGDRRPDVQVALTGQGRTKSRKRQVEREGGKGKVEGGMKQGKTWILVETTSQGTKREQ